MPVNALKLMSFAFGAAIAALTGTLFASLSASVLPLTFYFVLLITVYTMVILGGSGSMRGVVLGALVIGPAARASPRPEQVAHHLLRRSRRGARVCVPPLDDGSGSSSQRRSRSASSAA